VFTARLPRPPDAGISGGLLVIDTAHLVWLGALTLVVAELPHPAIKTATRRGHRSWGEGMRPAHMIVCTGQRADRCKLNDVSCSVGVGDYRLLQRIQ
jgi:hypothetical protein